MTTLTTNVLDLDEAIDGQRAGLHMAPLLIIAVLALICDGFDIAAMGYVAPELVKAWQIQPAQLVPAFSAGIVGMMLGGPLLGYFGDRLGRRRVIVLGLVAIGLATLATMAAQSVTHFVVLRFLTGIGLGGVIPNVAVLVAELSPKRIRGRMLVAIALGMPLGISLPGLVAGLVVPALGWPGLMLVGGLLPLGVALIARAVVPESPKFLLERRDDAEAARQVVRKLRPDLAIGEGTRLVTVAHTIERGSARQLFSGTLIVVTPVLWICQAANQMANFFSLTWLPTLLQSAGATTAEAGASASLFALGGFAGGLVLLFVIDRLGTAPLVAFFVIGTPLVALMASTTLDPTLHAAVIAGAGLCVTGINFTLVALLPVFYPTAIRSLGMGWTQGVGRLGSLAAPVVGGILLEQNIPPEQLSYAPAALLAVGAVASVVLAILCFREFGGVRVAEFGEASASRLVKPD